VSTQVAGDEAPAGDVKAAEWRQANYYRALLRELLEELDHQLTKYEAALAKYEPRDERAQVRRMRSLICTFEHDRHLLHDMLAALDTRFPGEAAA
jgi:hypothetical protein